MGFFESDTTSCEGVNVHACVYVDVRVRACVYDYRTLDLFPLRGHAENVSSVSGAFPRCLPQSNAFTGNATSCQGRVYNRLCNKLY